MTTIHASAIVEDGARLGDDVVIGPRCVVGPSVSLGDGVVLHANVVLEGRTTIGARTEIWPFALIGGAPQDLSYDGEDTTVEIGEDCRIREYVTIHRGTARGRGATSIGRSCFIMLSSHIAHDCSVGDHVIFTNNATIGGHCEIQDHVILGGFAAVQQRIRIGEHAFVGAMTAAMSHVVPFAMAAGNRVTLGGLNVIGLQRRGFTRESIHAIRGAYRMFFNATGPRSERIAAVREAYPDQADVGRFLDFVAACGETPLALPRRARATDAGE